jgi:hypothetical protein
MLIGALISAWLPIQAQTRACKSVDLKRVGPTGYTTRGTRCEGILEREVGGEVIPVVGVAGFVETFDPQRGVDLTIGFSGSSTDSVWIVASSVRPTLHYRMDTAVPVGVDQLRWPVSILRAESIRRDDIAVIAWTNVPGIAERIYLPVSMTQSTAAVPAARPPSQVTLLPAKRARAIRVSVAEADSLGRVSRWLKENELVPGSDFIEGQPVTVRLPALQSRRLYRVRIGADLTPDSTSPASGVLTTTTEVLVRAP